jgi:hypothetical protein
MAIPKPPTPHDPECRYTRRTTTNKWEYGVVVRKSFGAKPDHEPEGECESYEEACRINSMALQGKHHIPYRGYSCSGAS